MLAGCRGKLKGRFLVNELLLVVGKMGEVDPGGVEQLMAMGFDEDKATKALQRANNDFEEAVTIILDDGRHLVPVALCRRPPPAIHRQTPAPPL